MSLSGNAHSRESSLSGNLSPVGQVRVRCSKFGPTPVASLFKGTDYRIKGLGYCTTGTASAVQRVRAYPARFAAGAEPQLKRAPKWECASLRWAKWDRIRVGRRHAARCQPPICLVVCLFVCLFGKLFVCSQIRLLLSTSFAFLCSESRRNSSRSISASQARRLLHRDAPRCNAGDLSYV